ncbi:MAG: hypothetical protein ACE5FD_00155 [Anaerolineae bacterium]
MTQLSTLDCSAKEAIRWVTQQIEAAGLQVSRSFDLRSARTVETGCTCAHHDGNCDCDLVVLLVYGQESRYPVTLVAHSHDGRTWLSLADGMGERPSKKVEATIRKAVVVPWEMSK